MKTKILSILALLLVAATGAWAQKRDGINDDASVAKARIMTMAPRRASAIPTKATILYQQNFDDTNDINELGWTFVDNDGNGRNWTMAINGKYDNHEYSPSETSTSVPNSLYSQSFTDDGEVAINADNWAITPAIKIYESSILSFQLAYGNPTYSDKVGVYVGETANVNEMTEVLAPTIFSRTDKRQFNKETVDLSAFAGKTCYIAFRHQDNDKYIVFIDDVTVYTIPPTYAVTIDDAGVDASNWQATPAEPKTGQTVTLSYSGKKKIRSITIEAAPAPAAPALLQVTVHESQWSPGVGDHIIYYESGDTWGEAIAKHPTENAGWIIKSEDDLDFVFYGENQVWYGVSGSGVFSGDPIDANDYYEF